MGRVPRGAGRPLHAGHLAGRYRRRQGRPLRAWPPRREVRQYLAALRQLLRLGVRRWRWLRENPMEVVELPKRAQAEEEKRLPTEDEQDRLLETARQWPPPMPIPPRAARRPRRGAECGPGVLWAMILTAMYTGMRKNAVLQLQAEHLRARAGRDPVLERKAGSRILFAPGAHARGGAHKLGYHEWSALPAGERPSLAALPGGGLAEGPGKGRGRVGEVPRSATSGSDALGRGGRAAPCHQGVRGPRGYQGTERYLHARRGPMDEAARKLEERYRRGAPRSPQRSPDTPSS